MQLPTNSYLFSVAIKYWLSAILSLVISLSLFCFPQSVIAAATGVGNTPATQAANNTSVAASPQICNVGIFITSLYDLNPALSSFAAHFWLWSNCPSDDIQPMKNIELAKAQKVTSDLQFHEKKPQGYWSQRQFKAVINHEWDTSNFPFDRQVLKIELEDGVNDANKLIYVPDIKNSLYSKDIKLNGLRIKDFQISEKKVHYPTTFGDPSLSKPNSTYSRLTISITVARNGLSGFFKLNTGTYVAFALSLLSFFLSPKQASIFSARMSLLVGSLFAVVVNLRASESLLGRTSGLTLVDRIHIITMIYIFSSVAISTLSFWMCEKKRDKLSDRLDRISLIIFSISYLVINLILILSAAFAFST